MEGSCIILLYIEQVIEKKPPNILNVTKLLRRYILSYISETSGMIFEFMEVNIFQRFNGT